MGVRGIRRARGACWIVAAGSAASLALCAPSLASGRRTAARRTAVFSVTLAGSEVVSATKQSEGEGCPAGTASEAVQFTAAPFRIRVEATGSLLEMTGLSKRGEDGRQPFAAAGSITRSENGSFTCTIAPGTPPDCGTEPLGGLGLWLQGTAVRRGRIVLSVDLDAEDPPDPFRACPPLGGFPALFATGAPQIRLTGGILLDRRRRTLVLTASHLTSTEAPGIATHVEDAVTLTLHRSQLPVAAPSASGALSRPAPSRRRRAPGSRPRSPAPAHRAAR